MLEHGPSFRKRYRVTANLIREKSYAFYISAIVLALCPYNFWGEGQNCDVTNIRSVTTIGGRTFKDSLQYTLKEGMQITGDYLRRYKKHKRTLVNETYFILVTN